jgi:uncharacterized protein YjbI with pentapeptide repeats
MRLIRPLQLSFNQRVLEQNRKFYFTASATLGINLQSGEALLEFDQLKDVFACMGENPLPDTGMPKPNGEVLVSGKCFAPRGKMVPAHEVSLRVGTVDKTLYVFGDRFWKRAGGMVKTISEAEPFKEMEISFQNAYGGEGFEKNPAGKGFVPVKDEKGDTLHPLPNIEDPDYLVGSPGDKPEPAGFSILDPSWPQRMRFQGTYDKDYKKKYFPGYPEDFDWHHFHCGPEDQWIKGFFEGNETFEIRNMHPDVPVIEGALPGLYARCFIRHTINSDEPEFTELPMNLDTIWFFPEKMLALLIWRKGIEVADDEAEQITDVLLAYEDRVQEPRDLEYYRKALEKRMNSDDALLNNLNTEDLIPLGHKCAMELLQENAFAGDEESEFAKNIDAKAEAMQQMADEKIEEAIQQAEKNMENINIPDEAWEHIPDDAKAHMPGKEGGLDLRKLMSQKPGAAPDPDVKALNQKLEAIMPGITAGDPKKMELKNFSFDKIDQMMDTVGEFSDKKEKEAMDLAKKEIAKAKDQVKGQLDDIYKKIDEAKEMAGPEGAEGVKSLDDAKEKLEASLKTMDDLDLEETPKAPLPRIDSEEIKAQMSQVNPQVMDAMQHLQSMKDMGIEDERTQGLEKQIQETMETTTKQIEEGLQEAEKGFKEGYFMGAHFMEDGLSPHKDPVESVAERLLNAIAEGEDVSNGDWACIDLSGQNLDGVDLSGTFLEQVNFKGASLKGANLSGSIMARANLEDADLSGANLEEANVGAVHAHKTNFTDANLKSAKLSKGDFTDADFTRAELEDVESLEVVVNGTNFAEASMPFMKFIESGLTGTKFRKADLSTTVFMDCDIKDADFSEVNMSRCTFADARFTNVTFDGADLTGSCFAATDPEKAWMKDVRFRGANLTQCNFQGMEMQGTDLNGATLENANFGGADLTDADLSHAYAKSAQFRKARLAGARLDEINLIEGSLAKAYIVNASFVGANLYAVDFLRAVIEETDFSDSNREATLIGD